MDYLFITTLVYETDVGLRCCIYNTDVGSKPLNISDAGFQYQRWFLIPALVFTLRR